MTYEEIAKLVLIVAPLVAVVVALSFLVCNWGSINKKSSNYSSLPSYPFVVPPMPPVRPKQQFAAFEPLSIELYYSGRHSRNVARDTFHFGEYLGRNNITAEMQTPGDGTIRFKFTNEPDMIMFKLFWAEKLSEHSLPTEKD